MGWYASKVHRGIARYAHQAGWVLDASMMRHNLIPSDWSGDGIICALHWDENLYHLVQNTKLPVVNIGDYSQGLVSVSPDENALGKMAADYFTERGFSTFAYYRKSNSLSSKARGDAFLRIAEAAGNRVFMIDWPQAAALPTTTRYDKTYPTHKYSGRRVIPWLGAQLAKIPKPLALLAETDDVAIEAIHACRHQGILIPEQVAVLGVDNDELSCEFAPVTLSSIDCNQEVIGYQAAALLDRMMKGEAIPQPPPLLVPPLSVVTRQSTDIMAVSHQHVATVLKYIWQHYTERINAKTVAATVPISYRQLHNMFLKHVGRTIANEIEFKRLEKAKWLLTHTDQGAKEIASLSGFTDENRMGCVFRRVEGESLRAYRKKFGVK